MAKVFVSHRGADIAKATKLAEEIQNAGHVVWLDAWELEVGDSIVKEINKGLADAKYIVLCLSTYGVNSEWICSEWMSTLARQLNGVGVKLLPVRLTGGELPAIIADRKLVDLVSDWDKGVQKLLRSIR